MRLPLVLLACSLAGVIGGAWLIGRWAVGCAVIADSLALGAWAVFGYDDGRDPLAQALGDDGVPGEAQAFIERVRPRQVS